MATPGLSLVGFMDRDQAIQYLAQICIPGPSATAASLEAEWQSATNGLGQPVNGAGQPDIQPIPATHQHHVASLQASPWMAGLFQNNPSTRFEMVEIDPLLAHQFHLDEARSKQHCGHLSSPPTLDELFALCLPLQQPTEDHSFQRGPQSVLIRSRSLNLRTAISGVLAPGAVGVIFEPSLTATHVVRYNNKYYLHNGYHRTYGARLAGATHIPCIVRDVGTAVEADLNPPQTFSEQLLCSANPPTMGHYTRGNAHAVTLRQYARIIHVSWAEYASPEE
jgi:hypothetical protein